MALASSSAVLDVPTLVAQLMSVERRPIDKLNAKVTSYQTKISSFGTISGLVSSFQTALQGLKNSLQGYSATPSDANVFSATAASTAAAGLYSLNVTKLAQAQNLVAVGQASDISAISSGPSTVTFTIAGTPTNITIAAGATLQGIRDTVNSANLGVTATIINDGSGTPYRLVLTANETGAGKGISSIAVSGDAAVDGLLKYGSTGATMTQSAAAQNAEFTVNGIAITSASNTVTGAIQGVTLTLKNLTTTPATLNVARDTNAVSTAAASFVETYNALASELKSRSAYGSTGAAAPVLAGDNTVRQMLDQLRGIFTTPASGGTLTYLAEVGISTQAGGSLKLDSSKLGNALAGNFGDVANLFASATGFTTRLDAWATSAVKPDGLIDLRTKSLNSSIKGYNDQISKLEIRMTALQKQYTTTYSNLNMMLSSMNATSTYLTQQFSKNTTS
ncbi:MAG: flagellar filament capping protein FliD [Rhodocyclaceae bacterium]|nr:flagellar filament capping protein FliD [Rhodocyclaceae bacterium]